MELQNLRALVVLHEERQFLRAARRLQISQPGLSQKLQRIEAELGFAVFHRGPRSLEPTPAGIEIIRQGQDIITRWEMALRRAQRIAQGQEGHLRVGFIENASFHLLPVATSVLRCRYPDANVELSEMISPDMPAAFARGQIGVGIMRPGLHGVELEIQEVRAEPDLVALPTDHPLAAEHHVSLRELATMKLIAAPGRKANYLRSQFTPAFARMGCPFEIAQEVEQLPAIIALVAAGFGYTLLPASATGLSIPGLVYRPIDPVDDPRARVVLAWREHESNPLVQPFIQAALRCGRLRTHNQNSTVAARATAERKTFGHLS